MGKANTLIEKQVYNAYNNGCILMECMPFIMPAIILSLSKETKNLKGRIILDDRDSRSHLLSESGNEKRQPLSSQSPINSVTPVEM